jgi:tRNA threonylcarbamoyladenosine biosynthesis protein TsaE
MIYKKLNLTALKKLAKDITKKVGPEYRIFGLVGQLGAGKTTFTQSLAKNLGVTHAKSPTFTVINCYSGKSRSLYHIDLYRLTSYKQTLVLGLEEIFEDPQSVVVIEWVDKFPQLVKRCHSVISFEINQDQTRNVDIRDN